MPTDANVGTNQILGEALAIFRRQWPVLLAAGVAVAAFQTAQAFENRAKFWGIGGVLIAALVAIVATFVIQAAATRQVLLRERLAAAGSEARFGAYLGVSLLAALGIVMGLVLLIVPGVLLLLRWFVAPTYTLARGLGIRDSMRASHDATSGHRGAILGAVLLMALVIYVPYGILTIEAGSTKALAETDLFSGVGALRLIFEILQSALTLAFSIGAFAVLAGRPDSLVETFR